LPPEHASPCAQPVPIGPSVHVVPSGEHEAPSGPHAEAPDDDGAELPLVEGVHATPAPAAAAEATAAADATRKIAVGALIEALLSRGLGSLYPAPRRVAAAALPERAGGTYPVGVLRFPRVYFLVALLAVVLPAPSLFADFYCDDTAFVLRLDGVAFTPNEGPFSLYDFASGAADQRARLVDSGALPWWTEDGLRLAFCRPLSSALLWVDHAIGGRHPLVYHLHSIAWYVLAVLAAAHLFRRLLREREAALASLLFAVSSAHWMLAAWPSARHVAVSGVFALAAIGLHVDARERRGALLSLPALGCAAVALAGGETALGAFAYVFAYEALGAVQPFARRARALAPWAVLFLAYAVLYRAAGFGVRASALYVDPVGDPAGYLAALPGRLAVLVDGALVGVPSELTVLDPRAVRVLAALGITAAVALGFLLRRALRVIDDENRRPLRWLLGGAVLAVLPGAASIPGDRVLFLPNVGVAAALSLVLLHAGKRGTGSSLAALPARAGVGVFALLHAVFSPLLFLVGSANLASTSHTAMRAATAADIPARPDLRVFGIGLSDALVGMYLGGSLGLAPRPEPRPRMVHLLSMAPHDHRVKRTDERTLEIAIDGGTVFDGPFSMVVRSAGAKLHAGDVVPFGTSTVRILDDDAGSPTRFAVSFDRPLDDPSIVFGVWEKGGLRTLAPPAVGEEVRVAHELGPMGF
jgi:hypothetical protein